MIKISFKPIVRIMSIDASDFGGGDNDVVLGVMVVVLVLVRTFAHLPSSLLLFLLFFGCQLGIMLSPTGHSPPAFPTLPLHAPPFFLTLPLPPFPFPPLPPLAPGCHGAVSHRHRSADDRRDRLQAGCVRSGGESYICTAALFYTS